MAKIWTRVQAFRSLGAEPRNPYSGLSARSTDGKTVVVTLWRDQLRGPAGMMIYSLLNPSPWYRGNGFSYFIKDLTWAVTNCGGIVRVIIVVRDGNALPRVRMGECYPRANLFMRVTHLEPVTGTFELVQVVSNVAVPSGT